MHAHEKGTAKKFKPLKKLTKELAFQETGYD